MRAATLPRTRPRAAPAAAGAAGDGAAPACDVHCRVPTTPAPAPRSFLDAYRVGALGDAFALAAGDLDGARSTRRAVDRARLADVLRAGHARWGLRPAQDRALRQLAHPEARVVVTGQQVGWLLGPTYTLSKAATAVRLAAELDEPDRPVVPVFWMATQDHDVAEMDHAWVLGRDERLHQLRVAMPEGPAVGRARLAPGVLTSVADQLRAIDAGGGHGGPHAADVAAWLEEAAAVPGDVRPRWSDVFARLMTSLLGDQGLLVIDPLDPDVAALTRPLIDRELETPEASADRIRAAGHRLEALGWSPQLGRAEGATNLFAEAPGGGPRELLRVDGDGFRVGERRVAPAELRAWLDDDPTSLTPAAGLRPIVQDALLPTAAFVVGPGELRYLAQLRGVYDLHDVPMPLAWPRASVTVLQPPVRRILERFDLDWRAVQRDPQRVRYELALARHGHADAFAAALATVEREAQTLLERVDGIDPTLQRTVRKGRVHLERTVLNLRDKSAHALARQDDELQAQFRRLEAHLRPNGGLQERVLSPFTFFLTLGVAPVRDAFLTLPPTGDHALVF
jgi:bacillithiol biosynthesis cysteine-adding enzyme BshC